VGGVCRKHGRREMHKEFDKLSKVKRPHEIPRRIYIKR
jgi:hypothetical protein